MVGMKSLKKKPKNRRKIMLYCISWSYDPNKGYFHDFVWSVEEIFDYLKEVNNFEGVKVIRISKIDNKTKEVKEILCLDFDK